MVDGNFLSTIKSGVRYSQQTYDQLPRIRNEFEFDDGGDEFAEFVTEINGVPVDGDNIATLAAQACANNEFPEPNFLNDEVNGNLITNIDSDGNVIPEGTGNTFLTFNALCLGETLLGRPLSVPSPEDANGAELVQSTDIQENTFAAYIQLDYNTIVGNLPVRGNVGVRYIDTTLDSDGFRTSIIAVTDADGFITEVTADDDDLTAISSTFGYSEFLPSFNLVVDLKEDLLFRGGVFRALSRPDPSDLGFGRTFNLLNINETDEEFTTVEELVTSIIASGNPQLEPFTSWNFDAALEWYPNADTILAVGVYYKSFNGGFENIVQTETFDVNGEVFDVPIPITSVSDENSTIFGVEVTAAHAFTYLPAPFNGLGFKASYNYADSSFEFEDGQFGEATIANVDGTFTQLSGLIPPANLPGLSAHTANAQAYYNIGKLNLQWIVKYRSDFFQQFLNTPQNLRFIDDATVFEARISYKINNNVKLSLEGVNLFNEPRQQFNPTLNNFAELNTFGPRYFAGITAKF